MPKYAVATVTEIPVGHRKIVEVAGRTIGVFNVKGEYFALRNTCPHQGGPLCKGRVTGFLFGDRPGELTYTRRGEILRCPWHGWEFDIRTGQSWHAPDRIRVRHYDVTVASYEMVEGPYMAETFPVEVKDRVIFVDISLGPANSADPAQSQETGAGI